MEKNVAVSIGIIATCCGLLVSATVTPAGAQGRNVIAQFSQEQQQQLAEWITRAEQGDVGSQFLLGLLLESWQASATTDETREWLAVEAADWFRRAAEQGYRGAQERLGAAYFAGRGVTQDFTEAVQWFRQAAEQGHAQAQLVLGSIYRAGRGAPQDYSEAMLWYRRAAEQNNADAQEQLGQMYLNGEGIPQDYVSAHMWFNLAASRVNRG
ncbi:MAG: tetratricopeptide repeat protein [Acidobacteria bacterium]|nr:tetratricopeptide repeat protein [Acidobacteriota bacterium]